MGRSLSPSRPASTLDQFSCRMPEPIVWASAADAANLSAMDQLLIELDDSDPYTPPRHMRMADRDLGHAHSTTPKHQRLMPGTWRKPTISDLQGSVLRGVTRAAAALSTSSSWPTHTERLRSVEGY